MSSVLLEIKAKFESEVEEINKLEKDRSRCLINRRQLESQLTENNMELERLEPDNGVFKLIGPVLVKQDLKEAKENVQKRIEYIKTEINRVESVLTDLTKKIESQKVTVVKTRETLRNALAKSAPTTAIKT